MRKATRSWPVGPLFGNRWASQPQHFDEASPPLPPLPARTILIARPLSESPMGQGGKDRGVRGASGQSGWEKPQMTEAHAWRSQPVPRVMREKGTLRLGWPVHASPRTDAHCAPGLGGANGAFSVLSVP